MLGRELRSRSTLPASDRTKLDEELIRAGGLETRAIAVDCNSSAAIMIQIVRSPCLRVKLRVCSAIELLSEISAVRIAISYSSRRLACDGGTASFREQSQWPSSGVAAQSQASGFEAVS
jgi:hypothetical protein